MTGNKWKRRCTCNRGFVTIYVMFVALVIIIVMTATIELLLTKRQWHEAWMKQMRMETLWIRARERFEVTCPRLERLSVSKELFTVRYDTKIVTIHRVNSGETRTYTRRTKECDTIKTKREKVKR